jgi:hypothetical protein
LPDYLNQKSERFFILDSTDFMFKDAATLLFSPLFHKMVNAEQTGTPG